MKHAILALLVSQPLYGLQLRNELDRRLGRERRVNVGQVYSTIDRLVRDGLVQLHSHSADGLPLYIATADGRVAATQWLTAPEGESARPWESMITQLLVARSLPGVETQQLHAGYVALWNGVLEEHSTSTSARSLATIELAHAALRWLDRLAVIPEDVSAIITTRPPKGRPRS